MIPGMIACFGIYRSSNVEPAILALIKLLIKREYEVIAFAYELYNSLDISGRINLRGRPYIRIAFK